MPDFFPLLAMPRITQSNAATVRFDFQVKGGMGSGVVQLVEKRCNIMSA